MTESIICFIAGLVLLPTAAEVLVRGAVGVANRAGVSPLLVGLTIVSLGTSAPELVVCIEAALSGAPGIAYGNVVGSNIANILLILGVAALLKPVTCDPRSFLRDAVVMLAATALLVVASLFGAVERWQGVGMIALLCLYLVYSYWREKRGQDIAATHVEEVAELDTFKKTSLPLLIGLVALGIGGVLWGADLLVTGAVDLARGFGVPEEVIGLTLVAFGTSLPELATAAVAALRGHNDVGLGNVVGSNIFNILGIMGATAAVMPIPAPAQILSFDLWVLAAVSLLLVPFMVSGSRLGRAEAGIFLVGYGAYIVVQFVGVETLT